MDKKTERRYPDAFSGKHDSKHDRRHDRHEHHDHHEHAISETRGPRKKPTEPEKAEMPEKDEEQGILEKLEQEIDHDAAGIGLIIAEVFKTLTLAHMALPVMDLKTELFHILVNEAGISVQVFDPDCVGCDGCDDHDDICADCCGCDEFDAEFDDDYDYYFEEEHEYEFED